ncbi:hypothetical protein GALMADRAFT_126164 [Galerina marginata CBS 339.88]|uniref:ABC transmembrane type-1 domain-containing protein n=1 Tax=Galerina marginata (strain CBS 339.88) TaxID=685588 RepID=A0A067SNQ5_GALM3|nr:hypothetical protein GALMADRAFT_126164 [Galerina marginata CBS 339.88]
MSLALAVLLLSQGSTQAAPLSHLLRDSLLSRSDQCICPDQRTVWDILWNCLVTIFVCSWISVHPNLPAPGDSWGKVALRRLELMFWALISPEMIILWAMRQWFGARNLARLYRGKGWTKTHGYFIQMGGFMLYHRGQPQEILSPEKLKELYQDGKIEFPTITETEIQDRSKADPIAKALVLGQTTWFIAQCITRRIQGLALTELELVTVAFAFLNGFMYFLWWNKPLDVRSSVPVYLLDIRKTRSIEINFDNGTILEERSLGHRLKNLLLDMLHVIVSPLRQGASWIWKLIENKGVLWVFYAILVRGPSHGFVLMYTRLGDVIETSSTTTIQKGQMRVDTFYAAYTVNLELQQCMAVTSSIAVAFGAIHCVGWYFSFASRAELLLWRISSAVITVVPFSMVIGSVFVILKENIRAGPYGEMIAIPLTTAVSVFMVLALPVYIISRLFLLVEAFIGLRFVSAKALANIDWWSFVPHS